MTAVEEAPVKTDDEFDPALVTLDQVVGLTKAQATAVLKHYNMPTPPAKWKLDEFRKMAAAAIGAHFAAEYAPKPDEPAPDPPVEPETVPPGVVPDPVAPEADAPGTALEPHRPDAVVVFPDASKWQQIKAMAVDMARSSLVPRDLRNKPEDVTIILLAANDLGIPLTQALDKLFVIHGRKGMSAELMLALARRDGHKFVPDPANDDKVAWAHCERRDTGEKASISFTIEEAVKAQLVTLDKDGIARKSKDSKPQPWELFTADMLWARCVARASRRMFSDCLAGVSYIPDELGYIDADNDQTQGGGRHGEATVSLNEQREAVSKRAAALTKDEKMLLVDEWRKRNYPKTPGTGPENPARPDFTSLTPAAMKAIVRFIDEVEAARVTEPETVEDGPDGTADASEDVHDGEVVEEAGSSEGSDPSDTGGISSETVDEAEVVPEEPGNAPGAAEGSDLGVCPGCARNIDPGAVTTEHEGETYHSGHEPF